MKKKLLWILAIILFLIAGLWLAVIIFEENGRDYYYENGVVTIFKKSDDGIFTIYKNFKKADGKYTSYYENGKIKEIEVYENGKPNGERIRYFENGQVSAKLIYNEKGEWDGEQVSYYENGQISTICNYIDGVKNGRCMSYYENGQIKVEGNYKNGHKEGKWYSYDESGNKINEGIYINGEKDGEHIVYRDGEWWQKYIFENGKLIDLQENLEVTEKISKPYNDRNLRGKATWNKFISGDILNVEEFEELMDLIYGNYNIYYGNEEDEEFKYIFKDMYKQEYEDKSWDLLALYSMMNCGGDIDNPDTYLFKLDNPSMAQETYFKNCPKGCKYSDKEDVDFVCE